MFSMLSKDSLQLNKSSKFDFVVFRFFEMNGKYQDLNYSADCLDNNLSKDDGLIIAENTHDDSANKRCYLKPDLSTIFPDFANRSVVVHCNVVQPRQAGVNFYDYQKDDPRYVAQRAESYLREHFNIDGVVFFIEVEFIAALDLNVRDDFYNSIKICFADSNIELVSYRESDEHKKSVGIFSRGILNSADTAEKVKYLLQKIALYYNLVIKFEDEDKVSLSFNIKHIVFQNQHSIFKLDSFFYPADELQRYAAGVLYGYQKLRQLCHRAAAYKAQTKGQASKELIFYYAEHLPCFKAHCRLLATDLYAGINFPIRNTNVYLMLSYMVIMGIDGIYEKIDVEALEINLESFSFRYKGAVNKNNSLAKLSSIHKFMCY